MVGIILTVMLFALGALYMMSSSFVVGAALMVMGSIAAGYTLAQMRNRGIDT